MCNLNNLFKINNKYNMCNLNNLFKINKNNIEPRVRVVDKTIFFRMVGENF